MNCTNFLILTVVAVIVGWASPGVPALIDDERLEKSASEPQQWLTYGRDLAQQRFSPLSQINRHTVTGLVPSWIFQTGEKDFYQANPVIADGILFTSLPSGSVTALNASTGETIWSHSRDSIELPRCCTTPSFGVALGYGKVYATTPQADLIALDITDGRLMWSVSLKDYPDRESHSGINTDKLSHSERLEDIRVSMAPLVYQGRVYVGVTGKHHQKAEGTVVEISEGNRNPVKGYLVAINAHTGRRLWEWESIPDENEGYFPNGPDRTTSDQLVGERRRSQFRYQASKMAGGWIATTPSIDPTKRMIFFGTGRGLRHTGNKFSSDENLFTTSLVALDSTTGDLRWHFKQVTNNLWDYDVSGSPLLFDWISPKGISHKAIAQASEVGWLYIHDRTDGSLLARSHSFLPQDNLFANPNTEGVRISPGSSEGSSWSPLSLDPRTGDIFVTAVHLPTVYTQVPTGPNDDEFQIAAVPIQSEASGRLASIDTTSGQIRWSIQTDRPRIGGSLVTAGDLLFSGSSDGYLNAYDSANGNKLWSFQCGAGVNAPPVSFAVDGQQYIAVAAGGNESITDYSGNLLIAFKLSEKNLKHSTTRQQQKN